MKKMRQALDFIGFLARGRQCESEVSILCGVCKIFEVQFRT